MAGILAQTKNVLIGRLALPLGAFVLLVVIGRHSGQLLGEYALVTTYFFILQTLPLLGLTPFVMREVARRPRLAMRFYTTVGALAAVACVLLNLGLRPVLRLTDYSAEVDAALEVVGLTIVPGILAFLAEIVLTSLYRSRAVLRIALAENLFRVVLSIGLLSAGFGLVELIWALFLARGLALVAYLAALWRATPWLRAWRPDRRILGLTLRVVPVFLLNTVLALVLSRLDFVMLSLLQLDIQVVGHYAIAYRLAELAALGLTAVLAALFPFLAKGYQGATSRYRAQLRSLVVILLLLILPASLAGFAIAEDYVYWLFPNQYPVPVLLTELFLLSLVFPGLDIVSSNVVNAMDGQHSDARALLLGSALYAGLLALLIPSLSGYGAYLALLLTLSAQVLVRTAAVYRRLGPLFSLGDHLRLALACAAMVGMAWLIADWATPLQLLAVAVYGLVLGPLLLLVLGLLQPLRGLRFFYRKIDAARDVDSGAALLSFMAGDLRAHERWMRCKFGRTGQGARAGLWAVLCYRVSRWLWLGGRRGAARLVWQLNHSWNRCDIRPHVRIGRGLVLDSPLVGITADVGDNVAFLPQAAVGRHGTRDVGAGAGIPAVGDGVVFHPRAHILGGVRVPEGAQIRPHARVRNARELAQCMVSA